MDETKTLIMRTFATWEDRRHWIQRWCSLLAPECPHLDAWEIRALSAELWERSHPQ